MPLVFKFLDELFPWLKTHSVVNPNSFQSTEMDVRCVPKSRSKCFDQERSGLGPTIMDALITVQTGTILTMIVKKSGVC